MNQLSVRATDEEGATRLSVAGDLDITAQDPIESAVSTALDGGARTLIIDLSPTTFVDSTGLSYLLAARRRADAARADLRILAPRGSEARVVIDLAGIGSILGVAEA